MKTKRSGFTLVELLVLLAIIAILIALIAPVFHNVSNPSTVRTGNFQCVKTYVLNVGKSTHYKRVDLRPQNGKTVITVNCEDSWNNNISDSTTMFAQFEQGRWYNVTTIGEHTEGFSEDNFPLVKSVTEISDPNQ